MKSTKSKDGTLIAYEELGSGPPLVLVDGAFCRREFGPMASLAKALSAQFTVFHYDRRGRGDSGNTAPYAVEREIEDLSAVVEKAGGNPFLYGTSSGAALALRAVGSGMSAKKLLVYEPPFALDGTHTPSPSDFRERIAAMLASDDRDGAIKLFLKVVGVPAFGIFFMRLLPNVWPKIRKVAPTLAYDFAVLGDTQRGGPLPADLEKALAAIHVPTVTAAGGKSPDWMHHAAKRVAQGIDGASFRIVPNQDHNATTKAMAPVITDVFATTTA